MSRNLSYGKTFGPADDFMLRREMVQLEDPNEGLQEEYSIESAHTEMGLSPAELVELHEAIHEMLRMHDQHVDALTDGASGGAGESEPPTLDVVSATMLAHLGDGGALYRNNNTRTFYLEVDDCAYVHRSHAEQLIDRGLVSEALSSPCSPESLTRYTITDEGRRVLAEEGDGDAAESEPATADRPSVSAISELVKVKDGMTVFDDHWLFDELSALGWLQRKGGYYYDISDEGRAFLAERSSAYAASQLAEADDGG